MIRITSEKAAQLHRLIAARTGGSDGIRDAGLLDSALESAFATFAGQALYPTVEEKGARIGFSLISNHAFVDGNKRIGVLLMLTFLEANGCSLHCTDEDIVRIGLGVASGEMKYDMLLDWVRSHRI